MVYTVGENDQLKNYSGNTDAVDKIAVVANDNRRFIFIQNISNDNIWIRFGAAAAASFGSLRLQPGDNFPFNTNTFISSAELHVFGEAGANQPYTLWEGSI